MSTPYDKVIRGTAFSIALDEKLSGQNATPHVKPRVQLLKTGDYTDPRYGNFTITKDVLSKLKSNFDNKVRRIDVMVDFAHNSDQEAAGWIKSLELAEDGNELWAVVDWTPTGRRKLADKEFRYLSADFVLDYQDNESLEKFGPCLLGAGLTNRPVIKGMDPVIELQEGKGASSMTDSEKMKKLSDDLEGLQAKHKELEEKHQKTLDEYAEFKKKNAPPADDPKDDKNDDSDDGDDSDTKKELAELKAKLELSEKKSTFAKLLAEGKAIPAQEESFVKGDMMKFAELGGKALNTKGKGHGGAGGESGDNPEKTASEKVLELAHVKLSEKKASDIGAAISMVLKEDKTLNEKYQQEAFNPARKS
jgi:phage I-like protein